ncbi:MAG: GNAT family N-acetyltransferase [Bacteroidaceae bacterium]|nr:GNAT family N-acetyltransferase [Bacteroidaceae bacterium]
MRALEPEDLELLYTIENDPALWAVSNNNGPYSRYMLKQYLAAQTGSIVDDGMLRLAVCRTSDGGAVGIVDLFDYSPVHQRAEVAIALLRDVRGQGIGTCVLEKLERFATQKLNLRNLYAYTSSVVDSVSRKLFVSANYVQVGILQDWHFNGESFEDVIFFQKKLKKNV